MVKDSPSENSKYMLYNTYSAYMTRQSFLEQLDADLRHSLPTNIRNNIKLYTGLV